MQDYYPKDETVRDSPSPLRRACSCRRASGTSTKWTTPARFCPPRSGRRSPRALAQGTRSARVSPNCPPPARDPSTANAAVSLWVRAQVPFFLFFHPVVLVLESLRNARERGARILISEIGGFWVVDGTAKWSPERRTATVSTSPRRRRMEPVHGRFIGESV